MKDCMYLDQHDEHMKGYNAKRAQTKQRIHTYCEYFRYYNTNPQFFMRPACIILRSFIERKKMLLYKLIMTKEDSQEFKSTKNHESSNKILEYMAAPPAKKAQIKSTKRHTASSDMSFLEMTKLKEKLAKIIKVYEKRAQRVSVELPERTSTGNVLDGTVSQLSAIKASPGFEVEHQFYDNYGLTKFKDQFERKRRNPAKKSQLFNSPDLQKPKNVRSTSKKLERANSFAKLSKFKQTRRSSEKGSTTSRNSKTHKRTVSSESVLNSPMRFHKYTSSNKC